MITDLLIGGIGGIVVSAVAPIELKITDAK